ncbi:MAG: AAA family ATPase [Clostridia bacterium]|nr:AAA family ATPase [Clostridia bacterium]
MKITKIYIQNFGKLQNITIDFQDGINQFCYENGYGKTTLSIFIKAMFYGMTASRENIKTERKKYTPWQGGTYGGYVEFESQNTPYRITRNFAKTPEGDFCQLLNLATNKVVDLQGKEIGEVLFEIGRETFQTTAFFPQLNFAVTTNDETSANLLGLDKFKNDLANLKGAISQIKKKLTEVKKEKGDKSKTENLRIEFQNLQANIQNNQNKIENLTAQIDEYQNKIKALEVNSQKAKEEYDFAMQQFSIKQKMEDDLRVKQEEVNNLLLQLNQIQPQTKPQKPLTIPAIIMIILGLIGAVSCVVLGILKTISLPISIIIAVCMLAIACVGIFFLHKPQNTQQPQQNTEIQNQLDVKNQQLSIIKDNLKAYQNIQSPNFAMVDTINAQLFDLRMALQNALKEREFLITESERNQDKIDEIASHILLNEESYANSTRKMQLLTATQNFLLQAGENISNRFVQPANKALKDILSKFEVRGRQFIIDGNFDVKEVALSGVKEKEYSSQGYQDILSFCVRIYLLKEIYKKEKPFIVLDDTFVNLDDENMKKAGEFLKELASDYQIIYLCCNSRCKF